LSLSSICQLVQHQIECCLTHFVPILFKVDVFCLFIQSLNIVQTLLTCVTVMVFTPAASCLTINAVVGHTNSSGTKKSTKRVSVLISHRVLPKSYCNKLIDKIFRFFFSSLNASVTQYHKHNIVYAHTILLELRTSFSVSHSD
jgi:hypothetical protein